jgi:hypothetical protein
MTSATPAAWPGRAWLLAIICASSVWCLSAGRAIGPTFDEPFYMAGGLHAWRTGSHAPLLTRGTMPLAADVATLPAYAYERWNGTTLDATADLHTILRWARTASLLFWILLLVYAYAAAHRLAGPWAAALAAGLIGVEPVILGHAALATTDVALTACLVALAYHFAEGRGGGPWHRVALPGLWYGAALLAKASAVLFAPLCLIAVELARRSSSPARFIRDFAAIAGIGLGVTLVYCGSDWQAEASFVEWAGALPNGAGADAMRWIADHLRIFPNGAEGLVRQIRHGLLGDTTYLLGQTRDSFWYYFPAALSMKMGLALLVVLGLAAAAGGRALLNWPTAAAAILLVASLGSQLQLGVRYCLPVIAFASVGVSSALVRASRSRGRGVAVGIACAAAGCLAWNAVAAATVWPHGICYVNPLWGGSMRSIVLLSDSNCDWGQGLPDLAAWHRNKGAPPLDLWYFGTDPRVAELPIRQVPFHAMPIAGDADVIAQVRGRYLAVSGTMLHGTFANDSHRRTAEFLRRQTPLDRTMTFVIFDFTGGSAATR